jgi:hypothetical protein
MTALDAALAGQVAAEAQMLDSCTIIAPVSSKGTWDETTMTYTGGTAGATVYSGKCKVQITPQSPAQAETVGAMWPAQVIDVHLPVSGSEDVVQHCIVTIDSAVIDQALVGRQFTVDGQFYKSYPTARRLRCREGV